MSDLDMTGKTCESGFHAHAVPPGECGGPLEQVWPLTKYGDEPPFYIMCHQCAESYREFWTEMWEEYYRGCM